ncbi:MAG: DedA family protein [Pseudobdellovibrionaceae bacterium]|jgi:membrane protein DedA with SNARE-associated domain
MELASDPIFQWLSQYAYQPGMVYLAVFAFMIASGFGLPIPEEITIISVGLLAYMGANPELFPPPAAGLSVVDGYEAAAITSLAVFSADLLVFTIGRTGGRKLIRTPFFSRFFSGAVMGKIEHFVHKYGVYAAFLFRFTPGLRFPAHVFLGMSPFPAWKFAAVDGFAVLISVPTQILLVYYFGEPILKALSEFKFVIFGLLGVGLLVWLLRRAYLQRQSKA